MRSLLLSTLPILLFVGCGSPDLDDPNTLDDIIAQAIDKDKLQERGKKGEELIYAPNMQSPYTGWAKAMWENGQVEVLKHYKDGKQDGLDLKWYKSGQQSDRWNYKDGEIDGLLTMWHENGQVKAKAHLLGGMQHGLETFWYDHGQKSDEYMYKNNELNGLGASWYKNGQKKAEHNFKHGKLVTATNWKPNGEKCPITNVVGGNGLVLWYSEDGTEDERNTYKDGELVEK